MQEIYIEKIRTVILNKNKLEKALDVTLNNKGKNIFIEGDGDDEYIALKILEAINLGFSIERALLLKDENIIFQVLNIKDFTKRKDIRGIKSRIIGTHGKTLRNLNNLTDCLISLTDNQVGIIGDAEYIDEAIIAIKCLIQGSKWGNVYARLEREKKKRRLNPADYKNIKNEFNE